jgi:hypothetical protein
MPAGRLILNREKSFATKMLDIIIIYWLITNPMITFQIKIENDSKKSFMKKLTAD